MTTATDHKMSIAFTRRQLEMLTGKPYDRLQAEAQESRIAIGRFIHHMKKG